MMRDLPQPLVRQFNAIMKKGGQERVQLYLQYPPESVGALMRGRFVTLDEKQTMKSAVERIQYSTRLRRIEETHLDTLMVVDSKNHLRGVLGLKSLVVAPKDMLVRELMDPAPPTLSPELDQEEAVKLFTKYKLKSAPVIDKDEVLLGVVVYRDIFEIASAETEEDFAKMAGFAHVTGLRSSFRGALLRLPWLGITCIGGVGVSMIVTSFEATLAQIIALASFSPMIAGMGGNVGSQTATIVVRGLATGEIADGDHAATVRREIAVGILLGIFYGVAVGLLASLMYHERHGWEFGAVVGVSMMLSISVSAALAACMPLIMRRFKIDPATAAGPMTSTTTDLLSNAFYFTLASWLLLGR
ncbi:MAG: magnesium transporter [Elusimicrobia bacterium CG11_big_fil_rev_8_21_14_0_20_64_6]|nr:MAG: magnesium transporter [Elusimicrobia bacterium CG11_big_fil_rev_8_21_14_0_20_64_6]